MGIFDQMRLHPEESLMTGVLITAIISGVYCMVIGNIVGTIAFYLFLFCGLALGSSFLQMLKMNWVMKLMLFSWVVCVFVMATELSGIWPILVSFFGGW